MKNTVFFSLFACRFWTGAFTNRCLPYCFLQCFLKASVTTYQKQEVLAEKCPPPGKPVTFYECHPDDHAPAPSVRADFEVSSQMKICGPHSSVILSAFAHTDLFTQRCPYTQTLSHTDTFTHRHFYTQTLLHTDTFTPLLHTEAFTHRRFYTQRLLHAKVYTQTVLHTNTFTQRRFYTQKLLHTDAITHRRFYTQTLLHTSQFYFSFWRSNLISCDRDVRKGRLGQVEIAILLQFLPIEPHFVRKG